MEEKIKAYKITCEALDGFGISYGETAGKARYKAYRSCDNVYDDLKIIDFKAKRAPDYDNRGTKDQRRHG